AVVDEQDLLLMHHKDGDGEIYFLVNVRHR
ncbi:MAG: hypothetical protein K0Q55_753, partial [Verrucomicrobia bacterium]|nr:hypothetical protein [Verrucomicrobiota bacterium]